METAEKTFNAIIDSWSAEQDIEAIKSYGRQCAERALKDAANDMEIWNFKDEDIYYSAKEAILKTPIITP